MTTCLPQPSVQLNTKIPLPYTQLLALDVISFNPNIDIEEDEMKDKLLQSQREKGEALQQANFLQSKVKKATTDLTLIRHEIQKRDIEAENTRSGLDHVMKEVTSAMQKSFGEAKTWHSGLLNSF